ncbi:MAG: metal ABC transporter permease [Eubacteriales bacterium]|nr:metal ABC transporter permease [Eubacteriales bacterium]
MLNLFVDMFSYPFMVRAITVGSLIALCSSLLGVNLVLKRYSMIGDGLSHVGFGSLAIAAVLGIAPLKISIPVVMLAAFLLLRISESSKIQGDAAIALISAASLAIGVMAVSLTPGMNIDINNYMFGSILAIRKDEVWLSIGFSVLVILLYILFYDKIFAVTLDESFTRATGAKAGLYNILIAMLTAVTVVLGMRLMGALLISSLLIFPALTSMRLFKNYRSVVICSAVLSVTCFFSGIVISYVYATPAGASVVIVNLFMFILFSLLNFVFRRRNPIISKTKNMPDPN